MAGKLQIQESFQKVYDLEVFKREILNSVFTSEKAKLFREENYIDESNQLTASEKKAILKVVHYGNLELDDYNTLKLYEITLQPKVRIEQSKVGIQQYVRKMLIAGEGVLVNFINPDNLKTWRLTLVASDTVLTDKGISVKKLNPKRYTFIVGQSEKCKTISDRFADLEKASRIVLYPSENEKNAISLVNIFSVETLSKAFFDEYTLHYKLFTEYLQNSNFRKSIFNISIPQDAKKEELDIAYKPIRDFTKKLLGRIVFLYFVQKKGWLGATDLEYKDGDPDFIFKLFVLSGANETFYELWLKNLFFDTLNKGGIERPNDIFVMPGKDKTEVKIPFLNGGLFDKEDFDSKPLTFTPTLFHSDDFEDTPLTEKVYKKNEPHRGFLDFLNAFNFTVHEDSPEDHTVAVDPEMLGHIFENLLEDNKDKGAFYTPKEIVHYMCQESLLEYLKTHLKEIDEVELVNLVKNKNISENSKLPFNSINDLLTNVKICDPAIGSGAFPMGLLQEIFAVKELIAFETNSNWEPAKVKEDIIQNSIYGVDIEKGAVDIARLRFWLSLIVNEEKPKALPNLDYKIVVGDSLLSKFGEQVIDIDWDIKGNSDFQKKIKKSIEELVKAKKDFFELKKEKLSAKKEIRTKTIDLLINILTFDKEKYFKEHSKTKSLFEQTAKEKQQQLEFDNHIYGFDKAITDLKVLKGNNEKFEFFDWKIDFAEILNENFSDEIGFDIVIGNPPYFQLREIDEKLQEFYLKSKFYKYASGGRLNVYQFFIPLSIDYSKKDGIVCLIKQNSVLAEETAINNRKYIFDNTEIIRFDSFPERDNVKKRVFETVKMSVAISLLRKRKTINNYFNVYVWKEKQMQNKIELFTSKKEITELYPNSLIIPITSQESLTILKKIKRIDNSFYLKSQAGEIDMTKYKTYFSNNNEGLRVFTGAQIQRYHITNNPSQGGIFYLNENKIPKTGKFEAIKHQRIVMQRITGVDSSLRLIMTLIDCKGLCANSVNFIQNSDKLLLRYILGIMNSKLLNTYFKYTSTNTNITTTEINNIPIPKPNELQKKIFSMIVEYILFCRNEENNDLNNLIPTYFEQIIDGMVYELYFPELLQQHNRTIIEHLGELPAFTDSMSDNQKMEIINLVFNRLNEKNHPVRVNLFYMNSIPEIKIIEGNKEETL